MNDHISGLIARGYTLVTPTRRLSRYLHHCYAALQIKSGKTCWETPDILPWDGWLRRSLDQAMSGPSPDDRVLLTAQQQQLIWQDIIARSTQATKIFQKATTARQAIHSWGLCWQWQLRIFPEDQYLNEAAFAFQHWAETYRQRCEKNGWLDDAMLPDVLTESAGIFLNKKISLIGFDQFTPQQRTLLVSLSTNGCDVREQPFQKRGENTSAYGYTDIREEIIAAAGWARSRLESDPKTSIGIVVPRLNTLHETIENILDDVFDPAAILINIEAAPRPYSISLGRSLQDYPLIDAAVQILGLARQPRTLDEFGQVLRSPFIKGYADEHEQRARLDALMRKYGEYRMTFGSLRRLVELTKLKDEDLPAGFLHICREFETVVQDMPKKQSASLWARHFTGLLKLCGWPGERALNSAEYQTVAEWQTIMDLFAGLDLVSSAISYTEALGQLRQMITNSSFQPETTETPIQILGMTGAAGMQFDHLWIMGLHAGQWPPKAEPDPFIPLKLQRACGLPQSSPTLMLEQSTHLTQHLIDSSPDVILSYPQNEHDQILRPSPLIKPYLADPVTRPLASINDYAKLLYQSGKQETVDDSQAPAINPGEKVSGGTSLFKDQAACPFRAFARHRLFAETLDSKDIGLDGMDRGLLMHEVMEKFWKKIPDLASLRKESQHEITNLIDQIIDYTLADYQKRLPLTFTENFARLESERLHIIMQQALELERQRQPFMVKACEYWHTFTLNDITVRSRIDRIDQLLNGHYVIIDYKTGDAKINSWLSDRPDEPQLPLYAITSDGDIAAIVFARLRRGEVGFTGLAEEENILPGVTTVSQTRGLKQKIPDWQTLIHGWQSVLSNLAIRFREGDAVINPKNVTTCNHCDLHTLCRIYETESLIRSQESDYE